MNVVTAPPWVRARRSEMMGFQVSRRAIAYVRMTQKESAMAKGGAGRRSDQINRYWDWKTEVGWEAKRAGVKMLPEEALVSVRCLFYVCRPLPDVDNLVKGILDALNGVGYVDDKQVRETYGALVVVRKKDRERTSVAVGEILDRERWEEE
jgi:Holliday junction resolvase RusA-like endonuclease